MTEKEQNQEEIRQDADPEKQEENKESEED